MAQFDYTNRDYSTIRSELLERAGRTIPEWTDRNASDFMIALIDLWSYAADVLHYYVDRAAGEAFLPTATQRESVLAFANLYDYVPNGVSSAVASVNVSNGTGASVTLPLGTTFKAVDNGSNYGFYTTSDIVLPGLENGTTTTTVPVRQGIRYRNQSVTSTDGHTTSNGKPSQQFSIFHKNVDPLSITVNVLEGAGAAPTEWQQVQTLGTSSASDSVYRVYVTADGTSYVIFGNGVNGRIPAPNVEIKVSYAVSSGAAGNVPTNAITSFSSSVPTRVTVVGSTAATGGSDAEDIASIKSSIPRTIRTRNRAVTLSDFSDLALGVYGVSKAVAKYEVGSNPTGGSVTVHVVPYISDYATSASVISIDSNIRDRVYSTLIGSAMLGVSTIAVPSTVTTTPIYVGMDLYVKDNYITDLVKTKADAAVAALLSFDKVSFGQTLTIGEFYRAVLEVDGVDYVVIHTFNTTGTPNTIATNSRIIVDPYQLPKKGTVTIAASGGVAPPI